MHKCLYTKTDGQWGQVKHSSEYGLHCTGHSFPVHFRSLKSNLLLLLYADSMGIYWNGRVTKTIRRKFFNPSPLPILFSLESLKIISSKIRRVCWTLKFYSEKSASVLLWYCFIFMSHKLWHINIIIEYGPWGKWGYRRIVTKLNSEMFKLTENKFQGIAVSQYGNASELIWSELDEKGQAFLIKYEVYSRLKFISAV